MREKKVSLTDVKSSGTSGYSKLKSMISKQSMALLFIMAFCTLKLSAQSRAVSGSVKDENGKPMPGVSVVIRSTSKGTMTDESGQFHLTIAEKNTTLVFSFTGYQKMEVAVKNQYAVDAILTPDNKNLNEVVVIGYGTQNRRDVTGAVSTVKASDMNMTNAVSVDNLIQGKAAGVNVSTYTSQPGGNVSVTIRGALSPRGSNAPLYVIDGLPLTTQSSESVPAPGGFRGGVDRSPLAGINPDDIASVDVLKDASATAIYGSAAANGVILITTKKGKNGAATVNYNGSYSIQAVKKYLQPLDATQFRKAVNDFGNEYYLFNNKLGPYGSTNPATVPAYMPFFTDDQVASAGMGTNYIDYVLRQGRINDQNISVSGGNANTKVFTSFNYFDQQALLKNSNFKRFAGRMNLDQKIGSAIDFGLNISYSQVNNDNVAVGSSNDTDSPSLLQTALQFPSDIPPYNDQGIPNKAYYDRTPPVASYFSITNQTFTKRLILTPTIQVNISKGLKLHLNGGLDNNSSDNQFYVPSTAFEATLPYGDAQRSMTKNNNYSAEGFLTYDRAIGKGNFSGIAGVGYYESNNNYFGVEAQGFTTDAFGVDNIGIANQKLLGGPYSGRSARTKLSQFTRLNYTYNEKYMIQLTGRFDGTSNFPQDHQFGFFPGISGGWIMNRESFLENVKWLSQLKLRGGVGTSGNESITAGNNYAYSLYALTNNFQYLIGNQLYNAGFIQKQLGNPDLKWETDQQINAGVDFGFFNNRISGSVDYFQRTAKDLLDFRALPTQNAFTTQAFNVGSTRSKGFELTLRTENIVGKDFSWSSMFTFGTAKTYWVQRNPAVTLAAYIGNNDALHQVYGWQTAGLIRSAKDIPSYQTGAFVGNIKYVDANGDGKLDINDVRTLGNTDPKGNFGINNTIRYKGFDLNFFIYGSYGNLTYDGYQQFAGSYALVRPGTPVNTDVHVMNVWTSFNPNGIYPGFANDPAAANNPTKSTNYLTVKNSYFARLKNITLGYSLPASLLKDKKVLKSVRAFVDLQNLFYVTNIKGIDPEMSRDNNPYPLALTTAFGLQVQF